MSITYNLEVTNNQTITPFYYTNTITPIGKIERTINDLVVGDGYVEIGVAKIGTLKTVFANSVNANLHFYQQGSGIITIPIGGQFMWEVPSTISGIINCKVSTSSFQPIDVTLTLIGVV